MRDKCAESHHHSLEYCKEVHIGDTTTSDTLLQEMIDPVRDQLLKILHQQTRELLLPHQEGHPITYNHYITENLQRARREVWGDSLSKIISQFFDVSSLEETYLWSNPYNLRSLHESIFQSTEPDMSHFAATEALDCMLAYYKVALKRFIDGVAIEAIRAHRIKPLADMFPPLAVFDMPDALAARIAGESKANRYLRDQLSKQLHVLQRGSETCQRFVGICRLGIDNDAQSDNVDNRECVDTPKVSNDDNLCETECRPYGDMSVDISPLNDTIHSDISHAIAEPIPQDESIRQFLKK
ncbi:hypothetical protein BDV35DRAFT_399104 [Aspergillus flavus]|uniref:GED domain-containing protein n=1 Tax=Aspergillus flavus TaxID=5059 RepID=A0A5N6GC20_ASPFL|nr:hypothetical protein BDV35DRAFT_399104 [Aspergillus flavus]